MLQFVIILLVFLGGITGDPQCLIRDTYERLTANHGVRRQWRKLSNKLFLEVWDIIRLVTLENRVKKVRQGSTVQEEACIKASYIKPCSRSAADFKQCCVDHGNQILPQLLKGDKQLKIPNLVPVKIPSINIQTGPNLKFKFNDVDLYGLDTLKLTDVDIDFGQQKGYVVVHVDWISLIGQYDVDGKIMVLPVTGKGPENITLDDAVIKYSFSFKMDIRDGKEYAKLDREDHLDYELKKAYFKLDNLFSGNRQLGDEVNKFLNDNNQEVLKELDGILKGTISMLAKLVGGGIFDNIPFDELFLP